MTKPGQGLLLLMPLMLLAPAAAGAACVLDGNGTITNPTDPSCRDARFTYTRDADDTTRIALGYDVPVPVDSLTPVEGFRTYAALHARHQALASGPGATAAEVGRTLAGRTLWAYSIGDADLLTPEGFPEPSILINGGIHAREWQSPEAVTGFYERLVEMHDDGGPGQWLHDHLNVVVLPVHNIDGFLTTQRYPASVGGLEIQPREGRMRRKNLRHPSTGDTPVDDSLETGEDNFFGVDLNRNGPVGFGANGGSLADPVSLIYRGTRADSEPETTALRAAARLAGEDRLRMYSDVHSFTQVYITPMTGNDRRDAVTESLVTRMRAASGFRYDYRPGIAGSRGIGTTADWAAWTYQIPAWTLELEPRNGGQDYGGTGASHSGFILPEFRVAPMREEVSRMLFAGAWRQAGPPSVRAVEIRDGTGRRVYAARWQASGARRTLDVTTSDPLVPGEQYRLWLAFDRPMRWRDDSGALADYPGQAVAPRPRIAIQAPTLPGSDLVLDPAGLSWLDQPGGAPSGYLDYRDDAVAGSFTAPATWDSGFALPLVITVQARDFMQAALDADPSTPVDWADGAWAAYEDATGLAGDAGGVDCSFTPYAGSAGLDPPAPVACREAGLPNPRPGNGGGGSAGLLLPAMAWWLSRRRHRE